MSSTAACLPLLILWPGNPPVKRPAITTVKEPAFALVYRTSFEWDGLAMNLLQSMADPLADIRGIPRWGINE
jgi:hypothetical protein